MAGGSVTRVDDDLMAAAKLLGTTMHRSAAQQLSHWARIGLELERGADVSHAEIVEVLSGRRDYDELSAKEQAMVRAEWSERIAARVADLDLRGTWAQRGHGYVGLDDDGAIVHHAADGTVTPPTRTAPARRGRAATSRATTPGRAASTSKTARKAAASTGNATGKAAASTRKAAGKAAAGARTAATRKGTAGGAAPTRATKPARAARTGR